MTVKVQKDSLSPAHILLLENLDKTLFEAACSAKENMQKVMDLLPRQQVGSWFEKIQKISDLQTEVFCTAIANTWKQRSILVAMILNHYGYENDRHNPNSYRNPEKPGVEVFVERDLNMIFLLVSDIERDKKALGVVEVLELLKSV